MLAKQLIKMKINREEFLNKLSGGLAATCVACLAAACSKEEPVTPGNSAIPVGNTSGVTINLATELRNVNDFIAKSGVIVIRTAIGNTGNSFAAFSSSCPHAGATVEYNSSTTSFFCSAHGSAFSANGSLVQGPATRGLTKLIVEITGSTLTVKS
jgi:cytochrome b6-f complex iron-sulfur subunit